MVWRDSAKLGVSDSCKGTSATKLVAENLLAIFGRYHLCGKQVVGFAVVGSRGFPGEPPGGPNARVHRFEVELGTSWLLATRSLLCYLTGQTPTPYDGRRPRREHVEVSLILGENHPAYPTVKSVLPRRIQGGAWYIRVPSVAGFLRQVAPVLEARLATSSVAGYSGELPISFYRSGVRLIFDEGRISVEDWPNAEFRAASTAFSGLTFLQALLGYRSFEELTHAFPDCWAQSDEARLLVEALFPRREATVWPIG